MRQLDVSGNDSCSEDCSRDGRRKRGSSHPIGRSPPSSNLSSVWHRGDLLAERPSSPSGEIVMSLESDGYLSPDMGNWISKHRGLNAECFSLADRMNRACQHAMLACSVPDNDNRALLVLLLFA